MNPLGAGVRTGGQSSTVKILIKTFELIPNMAIFGG